MSYRTHISSTNAILEWYDTPNLKDLESALLKLSKIIADPPMPLLVIDHATDFNPPAQELEYSTRLAKEFRNYIGPRIALVVKKKLHYGFGRMLEVFFHDVELLFRPFRNVEEAQQWLLSPP